MDVGLTHAGLDQPASGESSLLRAWGRFCAVLGAVFYGEAFQAACVSSAVHAVSLVAIASLVVDAGAVSNPPPQIVALLEADDTPLPEPQTLVAVESSTSAAAGAGGSFSAPGLMGTGGTLAGEDEPALAVSFPGSGSKGRGGDHGLALSGDGLLKEFSEVKNDATFFGVKATGRKFAFVVDTSGSMAQEDRWLRARGELERSLKELGYGQEFYVAFFNHQPFPMPSGRMTPARPGNLANVVQWIHRAVPAGGTEPWPALALALAQKPDAVFLLTDGLFDRSVLDHIKASGTGNRVPIYTVGFAINTVPLAVQTQIEEQLTFIARMTGGSYRFVP